MTRIQVVHKKPGHPAEVVTIENTLEAFQGLLDGGHLEAIRFGGTVHAYIDEEGKLKDLPFNFWFNGEQIVGPAVFSKCDAEGEDVGLNEGEARTWCERFNNGRRPGDP